jgi:hypothetical protein
MTSDRTADDPSAQPPWAAGPASGGGGGASWAATATSPPGERATQRRHRVVECLPAWEPLPPDGFLLRRPGTQDGG